MVLVVMMMAGCAKDSGNDNKSTGDTETSTESLAPQVISQPDAAPPAQPAQLNVEADASGKVWHFVCADGCEGGHADAKGPCPGCGKELAHNSAFHSQNTPPANPAGADQTKQNAPVINQNPTFTSPEPPQNAQGVWHYTCPNGCVGGAGSAGPCASCGTTLAHNAAYHQ